MLDFSDHMRAGMSAENWKYMLLIVCYIWKVEMKKKNSNEESGKSKSVNVLVVWWKPPDSSVSDYLEWQSLSAWQD